MTLATDDVARRCAHDRPGVRLLQYEDVALPRFRLTLDAVVQRRKPIQPIEEFVLRAVTTGLTTVKEISGFLGLEHPLVEAAISNQWQADNLDYGALPNEPLRRVRLTESGRRAVQDLVTVTPERMEMSIEFDRLAWSELHAASAYALRPRDVRAQRLRELPARYPRRPEIGDLSVDRIQALLRTARGQWTSDFDLLAIRSVIRAERVFEPAVMLVFGHESGADLEVALAIDGRISPAHESALGEMGGAARLGLSFAGPGEGLRSALKVLDDPDVASRLVPDEEAEVIHRRLVNAESQLEQLRIRAGVGDAVAEEQLGPSEDEVLSEIEQAQNEREAISVRRLQVFDHPPLLRRALRQTHRRLLIISPWISAAVVDEQFLDDLEALCRRGATVHIGYGLGNRRARQDDRRAEQALKRISGSYANFTLKRLGFTHAKILIWDDRFVSTSFNWLSFRGDPDRTFRQEEGVLVGIKEKVDEYYRQHATEIEAGTPPGDEAR